MIGPCRIPGCEKSGRITLGMCSMHYSRMLRHGDPFIETRRAGGSGHIRKDGYLQVFVEGKDILDHIDVAQRALGKPLPPGAVVHHVDGDRLNNTPSNLVICPGHGYHSTIHKRTRALDACGHADWCKCTFCKQYDDPKNMRRGTSSDFHNACKVRYNRELIERNSHV